MSVQGVNITILIIYQILFLPNGKVDAIVYFIIAQVIINLIVGAIYHFDNALSSEIAKKYFLAALIVPLIGFPLCIAGGFVAFASNHP